MNWRWWPHKHKAEDAVVDLPTFHEWCRCGMYRGPYSGKRWERSTTCKHEVELRRLRRKIVQIAQERD